jgi:hypothetical protein
VFNGGHFAGFISQGETMHILPLILSCWSYKQHVEQRLLASHDTAGTLRDDSGHLVVSATESGLVLRRSESTELTPVERASARYETTPDPINYGTLDFTKRLAETNEVKGSHFGITKLCHVGTDAWESLKNRLAESGIRIDDDRVAELAAGFYAERALQKLTGRHDPKALKDEIESDHGPNAKGEQFGRFDAQWVREINKHPDAESIAQECYDDLFAKYPQAIGVTVTEANTAIGYDPNVLEVG